MPDATRRPYTQEEAMTRRNADWLQRLYAGAALTLLVSSVSWATARIIENGSHDTSADARAEARAECVAQLRACRDRELDDLKHRVGKLEHPEN